MNYDKEPKQAHPNVGVHKIPGRLINLMELMNTSSPIKYLMYSMYLSIITYKKIIQVYMVLATL